MKQGLFIVILCILQVSCAPQRLQPFEPSKADMTQLISTPIPTPGEAIKVVAWLDNPNPKVNERVMLYGSLLKHGVHLGGMAMRAVWPDENQERGMPNCSVQVIYGSGVCIVETTGFPANVYVPITISFEYQGKIYRGHIGFTPH